MLKSFIKLCSKLSSEEVSDIKMYFCRSQIYSTVFGSDVQQ